MTSNLLLMANYKKPLTQDRNATLGHPCAWKSCITPNVSADTARQISAAMREHTPFTDAQAYNYGNLPLNLKSRNKKQFHPANPMRPAVKQMYRSARRYPNVYHRRTVQRKAPRSLMSSRLTTTTNEYQGTEESTQFWLLRTVEGSSALPTRSMWRNDSRPKGMEVDFSKKLRTSSLHLSPRDKVEPMSYIAQKTYSPRNDSKVSGSDGQDAVRAFGEHEKDFVGDIGYKTKLVNHDRAALGNPSFFPNRIANPVAQTLRVTPSPAHIGNIPAGKVFRAKLKVHNTSNQTQRLTAQIIHKNNLIMSIKSLPHSLTAGASGYMIIEMASPFEGNCDGVISISDRRNQTEDGLRVVLFGEANRAIPEHLTPVKKPVRHLQHIPPPEDPRSPFKRHL